MKHAALPQLSARVLAEDHAAAPLPTGVLACRLVLAGGVALDGDAVEDCPERMVTSAGTQQSGN